MFSADLSWTDPDTEKVGERRERIARERSGSSATPSVKSSKSSRSSVPDDRELWWTTSLKKAKALKPTKKARPETSRSTNHTHHTRRPSIPLPQALEIDAHDLRDPTLQPAWTYTTTLSPKLPSGASLDPPDYEVPELEGDISSRYTNSSASRSSHERQWALKPTGKARVIDEIHELQQLSPRSFVARTTRRSTESAEPEERAETPSPKDEKKKKNYSVKIEGCLNFDSLKLKDLPADGLAELPGSKKQPSYASGLADADMVAWRPPSTWDISLGSTADHSKQLPPTPEHDIAVAHSSSVEATHFQRFIRRMGSAGPKIILDRMKEEWRVPLNEEADEEWTLEKQLWVLTAFQLLLLNAGKPVASPEPQCNTGKILELYGNLSEVYQLSAMHPRQNVHYLTTRPQQPIPLPKNVAYLTVTQDGAVPFPFHDFAFSHIRASTLPSLIPSAKLPQLFRECYRVLAPGGILEIRIMDAAPIRKTAGPKMRSWIEDRLSLNLERLFRCSKPCLLVPGWLTEAGFDLSTPSDQDQTLKLPCAATESACVDYELSMRVGRALWKDIWGGFVDDLPGEPRWWWEDAEVMHECLEHKTVFECGTIFAHKK